MSIEFVDKLNIQDLQSFVIECLMLNSNHFHKKNKYGCHHMFLENKKDNLKIWFSDLYPMAPCGSIIYNDFDLIFDLAFPMRKLDEKAVTSYFRYKMLNEWLKNNETYKNLLIKKLKEEKQSLIESLNNNPLTKQAALLELESDEIYLFGTTIAKIESAQANSNKTSANINSSQSSQPQQQPQ